ncbi:MAG TPA: 4'-phosphopantetheinyl transferase superfamily protein [Myxococcales bacterium]|nr:4'-phosphopantetheinyl transferase superfamily protein [Myxococcales bacterium]HET9753817.1 4'-phosphopantetheinyl transferase superfamily protein [Myxococcales bacterium]
MIHALLKSARPPSLDFLAAGERARAASMHVARRRDEFLLGRWAAKSLIASVLDCAPGPSLEVRAAASGQPLAFLEGAPLRLSISISHREGLALAALDDQGSPLGADLEHLEPRSAAFVRDYFTELETEAVARGDPELVANLIWSAKESALKALGTGLAADTRSIEVELGPELAGPWQPLLIRGAPGLQGFWRRHGGHVLTIVGRPGGEPRLLP